MKTLLVLLCCGLLFACEPHGRIKQMKSPITLVAVETSVDNDLVLRDSTGHLFSFDGSTNIANAIGATYSAGGLAIGDTLK